MNLSLNEIALAIEGRVLGDGEIRVSALSPIDNIASNSLVYADSQTNLKRAEESFAAAIIVSQELNSTAKPLIQVQQPIKAFVYLLNLFYPKFQPKTCIHPTAVIGEKVSIGQNVYIGPYTIIEDETRIGDNCLIKGQVNIGRKVCIGANSVIHPQVTIYDNTVIGKNVIIHASSVIGCDGFGYVFMDNQHLKIPHVGHVIIEDEVEIGASTVIDRATLGETIVGKGTKIDNLVQIAHSVKLGKNNILCAFTGIAGSSSSGDNVIFAANVGVSDHVEIEDNVILGARAGVPPKKRLTKGNVYLGNPARPREKALEQELSSTRIPIMRKNLKALALKVESIAKRVSELEE